MRQRLLIVSAALLALALFLSDGHALRERSKHFVVESALRRRIQYLCFRMAQGEVRPSDLCRTPLEEIPQLQAHFDRIREQDTEWYEAHGWSYLPQVECDEGRIVFILGERRLKCNGDQAEFDQKGFRQTVTAP